MSEYLIQSETLTGIADAIREKKGTSDPILVSNFAAEIESIQAGGGGENLFTLYMGTQDATLRPYSVTLSDWGDYPPTSFSTKFQEKTGLISVEIPNVVNNFYQAFYNCTNLETVTFEEGSVATSIANYAFYNCNKLRTITNMPSSINTLKYAAFQDCSSLEGDFTFNLSTLETYVFSGCTKINSLDFSQSTFTKITSALLNCRSLTSLKLPSTLTSIDGLTGIGLNDFTIPESVTYFGSIQNSYIETFTFNNAVTSISNYTFQQCYRLHTVLNLENTQLTTLPRSAFQTCIHLKNISLPSTLTTISDQAFYYCRSLSELTIPASVTTIGASALQCGYYQPQSYEYQYTSRENFIANIGGNALVDNLSKTTFTFLSTTPPSIQSSTFDKTYIEKIIVPAGCGEAYRTATNWTTVADYIEEATA